ncbi:hypothetical protein PROFUN_15964, partial [Planoprotostelium fungivorum]
ALAPFFVFQIFCVLLWCLDEYWYYSLFTLFMVLVFEATVVTSRLRNLQSLRNMGNKPAAVNVFRGGKWTTIESSNLVPGDIVSLSTKSTASGQQLICPCDILLLDGNCVVNEAMLTGESTPRVKESIQAQDPSTILSMKENSLSVLFGGTSIIQQTPERRFKHSASEGCTGYVLRTGFDTGQGKLMRMILFSTERITANTKESLLFLLLLFVFAMIATTYVLMKGIEEQRNRYKLYLKCILILTSAVPPELPMELSLAVNNSLLALQRLGVFCTEPFRIPFAGKLGTLTSDDIVCKGVVTLDNGQDTLHAANTCNVDAQIVLAGCHSLKAMENGKVIGDPMEVASMKAAEWSVGRGDVTKSKMGQAVRISHRFHFTSSLKRMSAVVHLEHQGLVFRVVSKGAPEKIKTLLDPANIPDNYDQVYKNYAARGCRILALASKNIPHLPIDKIRAMPREEAERDLKFVGFVIYECPVKEGSLECIESIKSSSHKVCMITGDNTLTACYVASQLKIATKPMLILACDSDINETAINSRWISVDETIEIGMDRAVKSLLSTYDLCVSGATLEVFMSRPETRRFLDSVAVFARIAPDQKEQILSTMKMSGKVTLMCGDGTNDVGALKQAHVGVALLNNPVVQPKPTRPSLPITNRSQNKRLEALQKQLEEAEAENENPMVQLGDASIASPFTSKVTTTQMFKILALNCLISAYSLSVLYLDGVKLGDTQATVSGILIAACFLFVSRSKPLNKLSKEKPEGNIFSPYMMVSIIGQFAVHLFCLISVMNLCAEHQIGEEKPSPYTQFKPNLINTGVYLISVSMQLATFAINVKGHPFMEGLHENRHLRNCLLATGLLMFSLALELIPDLNQSLELVPLPSLFKWNMVTLLVVDLCGSWLVELLSSTFLQRT